MPAPNQSDQNFRLFQTIAISLIVLNLLAYLIFGKETLQATVVLSICGVILLVIVKVVRS
jgi:membrane-bound ClpP family serine protease